MHRKEDEKPSEEFWEHFFREDNFQGVSAVDADACFTHDAYVKQETLQPLKFRNFRLYARERG